MASEIRELVTLFTFKMEEAGINRYKVAIEGLKDSAKTIAGFFGIAFGLEKLYSFAEGLLDAGKEANKTLAQIQHLARSQDDLSGIQDTLLNSALMLGVAYNDVADTFKSLLIDSRELNVSQEDLVNSTQNIYKAFRVDKLNAAQMKEGMDTIEMALKRGAFATRTLGRLEHISPEIVQVMADAMTGGSIEDLKKMAAQKGGLTSEKFIEAMAKRNAKLDADFAKAPVKLSQALTNIYSRLTVIAGRLFKMIDNSVMMAKAVTWAFNSVISVLTWLINVVGGAERAMRLFSAALVAVLAIKFLPWVYAAARGLFTLSAASWAAAGPWLAWAAAIALVALALEDIYVWMTGGESVMGDMLGPFDQFKKKMLDFFNDLTQPIQTLINFFTVDIPNAWKALQEQWNTQGAFATILDVLMKISAELNRWNQIVFDTLIENLGKVIAAIDWKQVLTETLDLLGRINAFEFSVVIGAANLLFEAFKKLNELTFDILLGAIDKIKKAAIYVIELLGRLVLKNPNAAPPADQATPPADSATPEDISKIPAWRRWGTRKKSIFDSNDITGPPRLEIPPTAIDPGASGLVRPEAMAPPKINAGPVDNSINPIMTQTNNITVTADLQSALDLAVSKMDVIGKNTVDQMARQLAGSAPRTERPTQ